MKKQIKTLQSLIMHCQVTLKSLEEYAVESASNEAAAARKRTIALFGVVPRNIERFRMGIDKSHRAN